jgi:ribonuclease Z
LEHCEKALTWDRRNRVGRPPAGGGELEINEFDYMGDNIVVFEENGVTVLSLPTIHGIDGSVRKTALVCAIQLATGSFGCYNPAVMPK